MENELKRIGLKVREEILKRGSIPSQAELVAETADAYCPNCEAYIVNERVTYEECCDTCGTKIEWHE